MVKKIVRMNETTAQISVRTKMNLPARRQGTKKIKN
jgi:hypothetical protein